MKAYSVHKEKQPGECGRERRWKEAFYLWHALRSRGLKVNVYISHWA